MRSVLFATLLGTAIVCTAPASAQSATTFTYQGKLNESGVAANGNFDLDFELWDALASGAMVGSPVSMVGVPVAEGLFTVDLDFGAAAFDNSQRWIQVMVQGIVLTPRQPITRAPYSIQTRGIFVAENGRVGMGTSTLSAALHVVEEAPGWTAILAHSTSVTGGAPGVLGVSDSTTGTGVHGLATATSGISYGGRFFSDSISGTGVYGKATFANGITYGGYFEAASPTGHGVFGIATRATGINYGGRFESDSSSGTGVLGKANATSGTTYGGRFESDSISGRGVYGYASASSGTTDGVFGHSDSTSGRGLCGWAPATSGTTYGVYGTSDSTFGHGVFGEARASTGTTYGGRFESDSTSGRGVYGEANATSGFTYGGRFESSSTTGSGVYGLALSNTGGSYGVYGESRSTNGRGVFGGANARSGTSYGVIGNSASPSGFDFFADGVGTNYGAASSRRWKHNIEPISDPLGKLAQLRGVYYDWDEQHGGQHDVGMIAEEVGKVLPEIVNYEENGYDAIGMDYSKMTPLLVEAVNALRAEKDAENQQLKDDVTQLQLENVALKARLDRFEKILSLVVDE